jgi:sialate O-acetylesterase
VLRSAAVPEPAWVHYAWAASPVVDLCDAQGLPAAPFRTDDFALAF